MRLASDERSSDSGLAFVETPRAGSSTPSYSSLMTQDDCVTIDDEAYGLARSWFLHPDGGDPTMVDGVSLGRAFELHATLIAVRALRAHLVLARLGAERSATALQLRDLGPEWSAAAEALGVPAAGATTTFRYLPDSASRRPRALARLLASVGLFQRHAHDRIIVSETPRWALPYYRGLAMTRALDLVSPGGRFILEATAMRSRRRVIWLADHPDPQPEVDWPGVIGGSWLTKLLARAFRQALPAMAGSSAAGRSMGGVPAVAAQDVTPSARAFLLGCRSVGGRVVTLEHGISGNYRHQVHSVADVLGVWGPPQARYHRDRAPARVAVEELGWPRLEGRTTVSPVRGGRHDLLFLSQPAVPLSSASWPEDAARAHQIVAAYATAHPRRRVVAKPHPAEAAYGSSVAAGSRVRTINSRRDSLVTIGDATVVATTRSTTAIEAMALGRPVVLVDPAAMVSPLDFLAGADGPERARTASELGSLVETLLRDGRAYDDAVERGRSFVRAFIRGVDEPGSAVRRLRDLVETLDAQVGRTGSR